MKVRTDFRKMKQLSAVQTGLSLVEVLVSMVILSILAVGLASAAGASSLALATTGERETAKNIAESQLEYIKSLPYASSYEPLDIEADYPGYSVEVSDEGTLVAESIASRNDGNLQKIALTVRHDSRNILTVTGFKVRW